jgi:hypothetical protein
MHGRRENIYMGFWWEKDIRDQNGNLDVYGKIILKWILGKENGAV